MVINTFTIKTNYIIITEKKTFQSLIIKNFHVSTQINTNDYIKRVFDQVF